MSGKGSKPRPFTDKNTFDENFDAIFRKEKQFDETVNNGELLDEMQNITESEYKK